MDREETIFEQALGMASLPERDAYLREACGGDERLLNSLQRLLGVHDRAGRFMDPRPQDAGANPSLTALLDPSLPITEKPGDRIGRYKLLEKIGEGGCGVVYMAEQDEPVRRRVALKVIKLGMDTRQVIARFEAERQALAMMDHPNIAKILDAGATGPSQSEISNPKSEILPGRPYFVMELVRGVKITDYCDQKNLSTRERLELFGQVCHAIQHAHQKGIIHRDIKPSNVLVTVNDGVAVPKVIDFGIAKATSGERLTDKTIFTAFNQFIGTPAYMSPEQADITSLDIDTRSDIYSLGVLLYELLTGKTPFDAKELLQSGLEEMRRTLREKEPERPSARVGTLSGEELTTTAQRRGLEPPKLVNALRGDLDWIVMKCLEKDRSRRYETANGLVTDLKRHLNSEPVVARPPSNLYRFQKTVRRNKLAFAAAGVTTVVLVLGVLASTWEAIRARSAEREQSRLREQAQAAQSNEARERLRAERAANLEAEQRTLAQNLAEKNRINLYAARIKLAEQTSKDGDVARVLELLDSLRPQRGEQDLRSFDWYYLWQLCHNERLICRSAGRLLCTAFSADGRLVAFAGDGMIIRICDAATGAERARLSGHRARVGAVAFCPDGKRIASAGADATVRLWDIATGKEIRSLQSGSNSIATLALSPDGKLLAAGEAEISTGGGNPATLYFPYPSSGRVLVWNTENYQLERTIVGLTNGIRGLAFSPDGQKLAFSGGNSHSVKLYDLATSQGLAAQTNFPGFVVAVSFTPDGQDLVAGSWFPFHDSGEIRIMDASTLELKRVLTPDAGRILSMALSPDGKKVATAGVDQTARLWDYGTGDELATFYGHAHPVGSLAFAPDGRELATAGWDSTLRIWSLESSPARQRIDTIQNFSVSFSKDGKFLASAGDRVEVRNASSGKIVHSLTNFILEGDGHVLFSPDSSVLAASGIDRTLHFWDTATWKHWMPAEDPSLSNNFSCESRLDFSPDSRTLVESVSGEKILFWNVAEARMTGVITNHGSGLAVAFTPDGKNLFTGGENLSVLDLNSNVFKTSVRRPSVLLRVSQDGHWLATSPVGGLPHEIIVSDASTLKQRARLVGHKADIWSLAFSHDSRLLASASWDGTVKIWQLASGQELLTIPSMVGVVWSVAFAPDDRTLAYASGSASGGAITLLRAASDADAMPPPKKPRRPLPSPSEIQAMVPKRAAQCPGNLVNLSSFFNAPLTNTWGSHAFKYNDLSSLTPGMRTLRGVLFDVRGIVQLSCANTNLIYDYPEGIQGIHVGRSCQALHFLQATLWWEEGGTRVGIYTIHFADGRQEHVPLVYGENLNNWFYDPTETLILGSETRMAWQGENGASKSRGKEILLYDFRWQNPHPESEIESIDFESSLAMAGPFLLAITAEAPGDKAHVDVRNGAASSTGAGPEAPEAGGKRVKP